MDGKQVELTKDEIWALQNINGHIDPVIWERLVNRGLVSTELETGEGYITPLGERLLAQSASEPVTEKPSTITAKEFVDEKYGDKNCCIIDKFGGFVIDVRTPPKPYCDFDLLVIHPGGQYHDYNEAKFSVEWLPSTGNPPPVVEETLTTINYQSMWFNAASDLSLARHEIDELTRELEETPPKFSFDEMSKELTTLRAELAAANEERGRLRLFADKVAYSLSDGRYNGYNTYDILWDLKEDASDLLGEDYFTAKEAATGPHAADGDGSGA